MHLAEDTLHIGKTSSSRRNLDIQFLNPQDGSITLDNLTLQVLHLIESEGIFDSLLLDLASWLYLIVLEMAVLAEERHQNDLPEEGYLSEE
jgi:hypothetical protein